MRVRLTRQVTDDRMRILTPGEHDLPEAEVRYYREMGWTDEQPGPVAASSPAAAKPPLVEIPTDWRDQHGLQQRRIASEISGRKVTSKIEAVDIIEEEIDRRKGQADAG